MASLHAFEMADADKPRIGFRVFASGGWPQNPQGSRDPQADATSQTLLDHLTWREVPSPFVSLWTSWSRAVNWAKDRQRLGAEEVEIVAVWIHDHVVYDAYKAATTLPISSENRHFHKGEVIILGFGDENDRNILTGFYWVTERKWETVTFVLDGRSLSTSLPIGLLEPQVNSDEEENESEKATRWQEDGLTALSEEVYSRTRSHDDSKVHALAQMLGDGPLPVTSSRPGRRDIASPRLLALRSKTRA